MTFTDNMRVEADWNRDLTYTHPLADITAYVRDMQWSIGFNEPYQLVAPPATMQITLDNTSGAFNVGRPGALFETLLKPDVLIRVSVLVGVTRYYLITLKTAGVQLSSSAVRTPTAILSCVDWHGDMMATIYDPPPIPIAWWDLGYFRTDRIIGDAFQLRGVLPMYPSANAWWVMGASTMGVNTITANYESGTDYLRVASAGVYGSVRVLYYGNNTDAQGQGTSFIAFIEDICAAELDGRFRYCTAVNDGHPIYHYMPRTELATRYSASSARTVASSLFADAGYVVGAGLCNQMEITLYPRAIGTPSSVLATIGKEFRLKPAEQREVTLRYRNPGNLSESCAATALVTPVAGTDYIANTEDDGSGSVVTSSLGVNVENRTNAARYTITNTGSVDAYITTLQIRGTPLTSGSPITVKSTDAPSMKLYGISRQARTVAGLDDVELVQRYADSWVRRFSTPRKEFRSVSFLFDDQTHADLRYYALNAQDSVTLGIRIVDSWLEASAEPRPYFVAGIQHSLIANQWLVTLLLEDYSSSAGIWKMGDLDLSIIGQTARLGF
jgi:hypothetical protein